VERLYRDNYFSIAMVQRDLGYQPLFTTEPAMAECMSYLHRPVPEDEARDAAACPRLVPNVPYRLNFRRFFER